MIVKMQFVETACSNQTQTAVKKTSKDVEGGQQPTPIVFIDKISITLSIPTSEINEITEKVQQALVHTAIFQKGPWSSRFKISRFIALAGTVERVLFQFGAKGEGPDCRFEFNPIKVGFDGVSAFDTILSEIFADGWFYVHQNGRVSRVDAAIDLVGKRIDDFLVLPHQALTYREFRSNGQLKSLYLGSAGSNQTRIYDKSHQLNAKGFPTAQKIVRVERTLRNLSLKVKDLDQLKNPFAHLTFTVPVPPPLPGIADWRWSMFLDSAQVRGLAGAIALIPEKSRAQYRKHLKANPIGWWDPLAVWATWQQALDVICA